MSESGTTGHRAHLGWALVLICTAQLMVVLDGTISNIALPYIQADLNVSQANLQWVVTGYALTFGGLLLLGGRLGDLYGRRRMFAIGLTLFAIASGLGGFAQNETMLLLARGLQGAAAAITAPTALALITTTFPAGPRRQRAFGVYAAMGGIGAAVGLILGGWLTGLNPELFGTVVAGWRLTFLINTPIGIAAALLTRPVLNESERRPGQLDVPGALTATTGLIAVVYGLTRASETDSTGAIAYGWTDGGTLLALLGGLALLVAFVVIERRVKSPLLPFRILRNRSRATAFITMGLVPAAVFAMFFFLSLFVQRVMGYTPLQTGFAFLPYAFGMVAAATTASRLIAKFDVRFIAGFGTALAAFSLFMFSRLGIDDSAGNLIAVATGTGDLGSTVNYWTDLFPWIVTMSFGMGMTFIPMTITAVHGVAPEDSGIGSGVLNTMQQVGGALGLATLSTIAVHFTQNRISDLVPAVTTAATSAGLPQTAIEPLKGLVGLAGFAHGADAAFLAGAALMVIACGIVLTFLNISHRELANEDAPEEPVLIGA